MTTPTNGATPLVEAVGVTKRYGPTTALDDVRLTVRAGEAHALVGRNGAGKSTLVSILTGLQAPDAGEVRFSGQAAPPLADREAWQSRVACVYQHSAIIPTLTVAENLMLNRQPTRNGAIRWGAVRRHARELLDEWSLDIDPDVVAGDLGVESRQMLEIARALSHGARFIILDEPTAQLDGKAIERLFVRLRGLAGQGIGMLFISHHLEEVYDVCETVTVYRDARHIVTSPVADLSRDDLVSAMTGDAVLGREAPPSREPDRDAVPALRVESLGLEPDFSDVSFDVAPGEVVGITGSASSGRLPLTEAVVGLRKPSTGTVSVQGRPVRPGSVPDALAARIGFVPSDRHDQGYVPLLGVGENMTMTVPGRLGRFGFVSPRRRDARARQLMADLAVKASGPEQEVGSLSGGNQQKIVMGRALADDPAVLVLMHPTRGVDVRSKEALLDVVEKVRATGAGVLIVSDELDDLRPCDRVLVMRHGVVTEEFPRGWSDHDVVAAVEGVESHV